MNKIIISFVLILCSIVCNAQTFELLDSNNNNIGGTDHYELSTGIMLSETKFHIKNISLRTAEYSAKTFEIANTTGSDLQVCFGSACYIAYSGDTSIQYFSDSKSLQSDEIDLSFKVAPFAFSWSAGDSATWRVTIFDILNPNDSASAIITWKVNSVSINEIRENEISLNAYPNPVVNDLTIDYTISAFANNARIEIQDITGKKIKRFAISNKQGQLFIDLKNYNSGIYFSTLIVNDQNILTKRIIKH